MSKSPLRALEGQLEPLKKIADGARRPWPSGWLNHRLAQGRESSYADRAIAGAAGARHVAGAGNPFGTPGDLIPPDETRVPAPARRDGHIRDTPGHIRAKRCHQGEGGRVLSRLQEHPLTVPGPPSPGKERGLRAAGVTNG